MKDSDRIQLSYNHEQLVGILMPSTDERFLVLKLDSGYNIGLNKQHVKGITVITEKKPLPKVKQEKQNEQLPKISIIHTGGTIASKVDYKTGGVVARFEPEELIEMFPELKTMAQLRTVRLGNMWSQDLRFAHYNKIAATIKEEVEAGAKGIVISHGTDTLHYTAAALSFIVEDLPIPVILCGSQRSSDRGSSDAALNLLNAVYFAVNANFAEVAICMHHTSQDDVCAILPGTKTRKLHTSRRDAFKAVNSKPIALVDFSIDNITFVQDKFKQRAKRTVTIKPMKEPKVAIIRQRTNMSADEFLLYSNYDGIVIESTGLGQLPISEVDDYTKEHTKIADALASMVKKGVIIILSPQTIFGRLNLNVYENQRKQQHLGILGHMSDMTTETTFLKLSWLLSNYSKEEAKKLLLINLRGELSQNIDFEEQFSP